MISLIQRVTSASIRIDDQIVASIDTGIVALIGVQVEDEKRNADALLTRMLRYRVFRDSNDKLNLSLSEVAGQLLLVPQFTLAANTRRGLRPGFSTAAAPEQAHVLFDYLASESSKHHPATQTGVFGADMQVSLVNDGPVTLWLEG